jgi:hypothetical protein
MYFTQEGDAAEYLYDFGDDWEHSVVLEGVFPREKGVVYPLCVDAKRACPPEDCGGVHGYKNLLKIIRNPRHKEHKEMLEWAGGLFDSEHFEPREVRFDDPRKRWKIAFQER